MRHSRLKISSLSAAALGLLCGFAAAQGSTGQISVVVKCSAKGKQSICDNDVMVKMSVTPAGGTTIKVTKLIKARSTAHDIAGQFAADFRSRGANVLFQDGKGTTLFFLNSTNVDVGINGQQVKLSGSVGRSDKAPAVQQVTVKNCPDLKFPEEKKSSTVPDAAAAAPSEAAGSLITNGGRVVFTLRTHVSDADVEPDEEGLVIIEAEFEPSTRTDKVLDRLADGLTGAGFQVSRQGDEVLLVFSGPGGELISSTAFEVIYDPLPSNTATWRNTLEWTIGTQP